MHVTVESLRSFYNSKWYPTLVFLLTLVGHTTGFDIAFYAVTVLTAAIGCFVARDLRFMISIFLMTIFFVTPAHSPNVPAYSDYYAQPWPLAAICVCFGVLLCSIGVFIFRNYKTAHALPHKGTFLGLVVFCVGICANGLLNASYTVQNLVYAISFPAFLLGVFVLYALFLRFTENVFDYFMFCLMLSAMQIVTQLLLAYLLGNVEIIDGNVVKESVVLGWGVWTNIGGMLAFLMPSCFYFAATHKYAPVFYLLGLLCFFSTFLSQSRAALLVGAGTLVLCLFTVCFFGKNKSLNRLMTLGLGLLGIVGMLVLWDKISILLQNFINYGFSDNGRYDLWETAWDRFCAHPIFGAGFYDSGIEQEWKINVYPYFYHNTFMQMLGACGAVGFVAYLFHRAQTVVLFFKRPNLIKGFLAISILSMLIFCMLDVLFFITYPLIFYSLMLLMMEKSTQDYN